MNMILGKQHIRSQTVQNGMLKNVFDFICVYIPQNLRVLYWDEPGIVGHFSVLCCVVLCCITAQSNSSDENTLCPLVVKGHDSRKPWAGEVQNWTLELCYCLRESNRL